MVAERDMGEQPVDRHAVGSRRAAWRVIASVEQPEKVIDVPVAAQHQAPTVQAVEKTVEVRQVQFLDRVADIPVSMQRQMLQKQVSELISEWFNAVKGVSDSEDLPLNVYREPLLQNKILRVIKKSRVTKYRDMLAEIAELEDDYKKFYELYGKCRNDEDSTVGVKTAELLTFNTSKLGDEQFSFDEYVDRMKEGENDICCITGESIAVVSSRKKGHEVLSVGDPVDECVVRQPKEFHGTKLKPTTNEGLEFGDQDEKKKHEELKAEFKPLMKLMKDVLGNNVEMVIVSDRIVDSPCVLTTSEYGWSAKTRRIMNAQALRDNSITSDRVSKKTMEMNPTHPIMTELETRTPPRCPMIFQTMGPAPTSKRGCLATHLVVFGIGAVMGAVVKGLLRQESPGLVAPNLSHSTPAEDTAQPYSGERFFAGGPGENVLIPYVGRQPLQNQLLTTMQTAETFEISFDITPHAAAPSSHSATIAHFGNQEAQRLPGFWLYPGCTRLYVVMDGRDGGQFWCLTEALPFGQVTHVIFRLEGGFYTVSVNGRQACNVGGFLQNRVPPQPSVDVWFSDPWHPPADVTVANLVYTSLYACGPIG